MSDPRDDDPSAPSDPAAPVEPTGAPADETESGPSLTPTDAFVDPVESEREQRRIDSDVGLSPASAMGAGAGAAHGGARDYGAGAPHSAFESGSASSDKTMPLVVYGLYLVGIPTGGLTCVAGVILAYMSRNDAPDWVRSHYAFQIRTFWIALIAFLIGVITSFVGVGILVLLGLAVWLIVRTALGLNHLSKGQAHPNPRTWTV
ncbi:MAG TPA: hypothetical protein VD929_05425 [Caulobacteraceae bacterium]|nr:hypothetical protein [Caulobacteraceae bacterium]